MTLEQLQESHDNNVAKQRPLKAALLKIEQRFKKDWEKYLDQQLKDKNGKVVKVGNYITNGKRKYHVIDRGMQNLFGKLMGNPRVMVVLHEGGSRRPIHIRPLELKEFVLTDLK